MKKMEKWSYIYCPYAWGPILDFLRGSQNVFSQIQDYFNKNNLRTLIEHSIFLSL